MSVRIPSLPQVVDERSIEIECLFLVLNKHDGISIPSQRRYQAKFGPQTQDLARDLGLKVIDFP